MNEREPTLTTNDPMGEQRLAELILYVSRECTLDASFGATKLNKILWWSDFLAYAQYGQPITGVEYRRLGNGPVPRRLVPVRDALIADGSAVEIQRQILGGYIQKRIAPQRAPDINVFSAAQIEIVRDVIDALKGRSAAEVSRLSHGKAWEIAGDGESIPYEAVFLSDESVTPYDVARARELNAKYGWEEN